MWKIKVLIQFVLSRLFLGENINYILQRLNKSFSLKISENRILSLSKDLRKINEFIQLENSVVVEIGTGWDAINPILLYICGAKVCHTYDHVRHVRFNLARLAVKAIHNHINDLSGILSIPAEELARRAAILEQAKNIDDLFLKANIIYHAPGDAVNTGLESHSVDLVYSHGVLEHIPKQTILDLTIEAKRILKQSGITFHLIGLQDHYRSFDKNISQVNFLQYSERWWAFFNYNKISYHNRLRQKQHLDLLHSCGANVRWIDSMTDQSDIEALKTMKIDPSFSGMTIEELAIHTSRVILSFQDKAEFKH